MRNTTENKKNQEQISLLNHNELNKQNEENLAKFKEEVQEIINRYAFDVLCPDICFLTREYLSENEDLVKISDTISEIITTDKIINNSNLIHNIIFSFTQGYMSSTRTLTQIGDVISKIIEKNPNLAHNIITGFVQGCVSIEDNLTDISGVIFKIIEKKPNLAHTITGAFTCDCISAGKDLTDISGVISKIIEKNPNSVHNIITGFVQGCLMQEPNNEKINIKDITENFFSLLNTTNKDNFGKNEKKIKDELKPIFSLIISQYFINTLTNSGSKQLSEEDKKQTETKLFECYQELFHKEDKEKIASFKDISLKELLDLQDEYLKEKFNIYNDMNSGGLECETFLKIACNLMLKLKGNKELTVKDLEEQKDIFKDLKFISLCNNDNIQLKEQLFHKIGLEQEDFGTKREGEFSNFDIVYCNYLDHAFVMIIDKTKRWDEAIKPETESIYLIDSSRNIETRKIIFYSSLEDKRYIFNSTPTLNKYGYQENGTCWLNAMSAVGFLLERQQKHIKEEQEREQQEQTEQRPRKPYGLSINELLEGFNKKLGNKSGKIVIATFPQKELSSFEQSICKYSTLNFFVLVDISDKEKAIITKILAEQVKQNKADQEKLSTASSQLEKSKEEQDKVDNREISTMFIITFLNSENFLIKRNYLIKSFEQLTQNAEELKESCIKLGINYTPLLESNQKEDSSNKKQKYNIFSSCIPDNTEGQNPKNITKQNETCCTIL